MALSGTRDEADTVADIIKDALTKVNVLVAGESPDTADQAACLRALKHMLRTWAARGVRLWLTDEQSVSLTEDQATYALTIRALNVTDARRRAGGNDTPLRIYTREEYNRLPNKAASGSPFAVFVDRGRTSTSITCYPVPDANSESNDTIYVTSKLQIQDVTDAAEDIEVPPEWTEALVYNLAVRIAPDFEVTPRADVVQMADMLYRELSGQDREGSVFMRPSRYC
jgi:hypothetical protein